MCPAGEVERYSQILSKAEVVHGLVVDGEAWVKNGTCYECVRGAKVRVPEKKPRSSPAQLSERPCQSNEGYDARRLRQGQQVSPARVWARERWGQGRGPPDSPSSTRRVVGAVPWRGPRSSPSSRHRRPVRASVCRSAHVGCEGGSVQDTAAGHTSSCELLARALRGDSLVGMRFPPHSTLPPPPLTLRYLTHLTPLHILPCPLHL
jgi:hypothetical protein